MLQRADLQSKQSQQTEEQQSELNKGKSKVLPVGRRNQTE